MDATRQGDDVAGWKFRACSGISSRHSIKGSSEPFASSARVFSGFCLSFVQFLNNSCSRNKNFSPLMPINCLVNCPINRRVKETKRGRDKKTKRRRDEGRRAVFWNINVHELFTNWPWIDFGNMTVQKLMRQLMSINGETFLAGNTNEHELNTNRHTKVCEEIPNFATSKR